MPRVLDPFQFLVIAVSGWMNQRQRQTIESMFLLEWISNQILLHLAIAVGTLMLSAPRTKPGGRYSRTGLPPWVIVALH